jgi:hypothetical protein
MHGKSMKIPANKGIMRHAISNANIPKFSFQKPAEKIKDKKETEDAEGVNP